MIALVWALLRTPWGAGVALTLAGLAALAAWGGWRERQGRAAERARIETTERKARDASVEALRDVRACGDAGGLWDIAAGRCKPRLP